MTTDRETIAKLRKLLVNGQFPINSRLPPERQLCVQLGVSRAALRFALARLESEGKLWRHVGKGTFVGSRPAPETASQPIIRQLTSPVEVMEVRLLIEPRIASLAAIRATTNDIDYMRQCLKKLERSIQRSDGGQSGVIYDRWDGTLHRAVAESTKNALLLALFDSLNAVRNLSSWGRLQEAALTRDRWQLYCQQHRAFVEAIEARDPALAERAMRQHLEVVQQNLLGVTFSSSDENRDADHIQKSIGNIRATRMPS